MEFIIQQSSTSPPGGPSPVSAGRTSKPDGGPSTSFEKLLRAKKAEQEELEKEAANAAAAAAAQPTAVPPVPITQSSEGETSGQNEGQPVNSISGVTPQSTTGSTSTLTTEGTNPQAAGFPSPESLAGAEGNSTAALVEPTPSAEETAAEPTAAAANSVTFLKGTGTDGMAQGAVTASADGTLFDSQAEAGALTEVSEPEKVKSAETEPKKAEPAGAAVKAAEQNQEVSRNAKPALETDPTARVNVEAKNSGSKSAANEEEQVTSASKITTAASTGMESVRTTVTVQEQAPRVETPAASLAQQIHEGIEASVRQGKTAIRLQLYPQELGPIDIRLVSSAHGVSVTVFTDQASTGRLLEAQINQLRQSLTDAGVQLSNLNVNHQNQPGQFSQNQNQQMPQQLPYHRLKHIANGETEETAGKIKTNLKPGAAVDYRV